MPLEVVVLAAGNGKRMRSRTPKVLHQVADRPMLSHVLETVSECNPDRVHAVIRPAMESVAADLFGNEIQWVHQAEPLGTGHAVQQAIQHISPASRVLVVNGDAPLLTSTTIQRVLEQDPNSVSVVTVELDDPTGYGRMVRNPQGQVCAIVEERDATTEQRLIREVNSGAIAAPARLLTALLTKLQRANDQGEYYLTDIVGIAVSQGICVNTLMAPTPEEALGVNDRIQLAKAERVLLRRRADDAMRHGVSLRDPDRFDLRGALTAGLDCTIDINVVMEGEVVLGERVQIGPGCVLRDVEIGNDSEIREFSVLEHSRIGRKCSIGPLARIRPESILQDDVRIGNFVEVKASTLGKGTRAGHLAYIGDAEVGVDGNFGAGAITCNFDGASKHRTQIGDNVFIGTNCTLVAPLKVATGAFLAAGSTITHNVEEDVLAVGRARQRTISRWKSPHRRKT